MRITRIYQATDLAENQAISLDSQATTHVARVLKLKVADKLVIFNGDGSEYHGQIASVSKRELVVDLQTRVTCQNESRLSITLAQCLSRADRMDYALQKSVELGVSEIVPIESQRSGARLSTERITKRQQHWQRVVISACEQCGRNVIPTVHPVVALNEWVVRQSSDFAFILSLQQNAIKQETPTVKPDASISVLIGPEGGFAEEEEQLSIQNEFIPLQLGPRVLRTETAAVVALTVLQSKWGDF